MTQLSFQFVNFPEGNTLFEFDKYIRPDGWQLPADPFFKKHGFTMEKLTREGIPVAEALQVFAEYCEHADMFVAHNINFDYNVIRAEMHRIGLRVKNRKFRSKFCTMNFMAPICRFTYKTGGGIKPPNLSELYRYLFKRDMIGNHNAMMDTEALRQIFFELVNRGKINPIKWHEHEYQRAANTVLAAQAGDEAGNKTDSTGTTEGRTKQGELF